MAWPCALSHIQCVCVAVPLALPCLATAHPCKLRGASCTSQPHLVALRKQRGGFQLCAGQNLRKECAPVLADVVGAVFLHAALLVKRLTVAEQALELDLTASNIIFLDEQCSDLRSSCTSCMTNGSSMLRRARSMRGSLACPSPKQSHAQLLHRRGQRSCGASHPQLSSSARSLRLSGSPTGTPIAAMIAAPCTPLAVITTGGRLKTQSSPSGSSPGG